MKASSVASNTPKTSCDIHSFSLVGWIVLMQVRIYKNNDVRQGIVQKWSVKSSSNLTISNFILSAILMVRIIWIRKRKSCVVRKYFWDKFYCFVLEYSCMLSPIMVLVTFSALDKKPSNGSRHLWPLPHNAKSVVWLLESWSMANPVCSAHQYRERTWTLDEWSAVITRKEVIDSDNLSFVARTILLWSSAKYYKVLSIGLSLNPLKYNTMHPQA